MTIALRPAWAERVQEILDQRRANDMEHSWNWLARRIGISQAYMSKLKNGTRRMTPNIQHDIVLLLNQTETKLFGSLEES
jgi:plasmid maintenance system antidote protein VapI